MMRIQKFFCDITAVTFSPLFAYLKNTWNVEQRLKLEIKEKYASDAVKNIEAIRFFYRAVWLGFVLALRVILRIQKGCIVSDRMRALDFFSGFRNMQLTSGGCVLSEDILLSPSETMTYRAEKLQAEKTTEISSNSLYSKDVELLKFPTEYSSRVCTKITIIL